MNCNSSVKPKISPKQHELKAKLGTSDVGVRVGVTVGVTVEVTVGVKVGVVETVVVGVGVFGV